MNNFYRPDADGSGRFISPPIPPVDPKIGKITLSVEGVPVKYLLELKAEIAQLTAENARLREAANKTLEVFCELSSSAELHLPIGDYQKWSQTSVLLYDAKKPTTPGLGAAMLRVVEAATNWSQSWGEHEPGHYHRDPFLAAELNNAVKALKEKEKT